MCMYVDQAHTVDSVDHHLAKIFIYYYFEIMCMVCF